MEAQPGFHDLRKSREYFLMVTSNEGSPEIENCLDDRWIVIIILLFDFFMGWFASSRKIHCGMSMFWLT